MKLLLVVLSVVGIALAFDCYGRQNNCTTSHIKCDTGYTPFCEHREGPGPASFIGCCSCDKECNNATDCSNPAAEGCPRDWHAVCDMRLHVCHCLPRRPPMDTRS